MTLSQAFGISECDIAAVLESNKANIAVPFSSLDALAIEVYSNWAGSDIMDRIAREALNGGTSLDEQTDAAWFEIRQVLLEQGTIHE